MSQGYGINYGSRYGYNDIQPLDPRPQAGERNPFVYLYGTAQGRTKGLTNYQPTDGEYIYTLGSDLRIPHNMRVGDYIDVRQVVNFDGVNVLRVDLKVLQASNMPTQRDVSLDATLQRGRVIDTIPARLLTQITEPYALVDNDTLEISVDGGAPQTITFTADKFIAIGAALASEVSATIRSQLVGGTSREIRSQTATPGVTVGRVLIESATIGYTSTIEIAGGTAAAALDFPVHNGRDDLSAVVAPLNTFSQADIGKTLLLSGTDGGVNDMTTRITGVLGSRIATLYDQVVSESTGFTAVIQGALWEASIWIADQLVKTFQPQRGRFINTTDIGINVSKLNTLEALTIRFALVSDP